MWPGCAWGDCTDDPVKDGLCGFHYERSRRQAATGWSTKQLAERVVRAASPRLPGLEGEDEHGGETREG